MTILRPKLGEGSEYGSKYRMLMIALLGGALASSACVTEVIRGEAPNQSRATEVIKNRDPNKSPKQEEKQDANKSPKQEEEEPEDCTLEGLGRTALKGILNGTREPGDIVFCDGNEWLINKI